MQKLFDPVHGDPTASVKPSANADAKAKAAAALRQLEAIPVQEAPKKKARSLREIIESCTC